MKKINIRYRGMQGCYWMLYCVCYGYMTYYLSGKGYSTAEIGVISAAFGIISTLLQPVFGRMTDRSEHGWKIPLSVLLATTLMICIGLLLIDSCFTQGMMFGTLIMAVGVMMPLINAVCFSCTESGRGVDYGIARGIGSIGYAVVSVMLGYLLKVMDELLIPVSAGMIAIALAVLTLRMPFHSAVEVGHSDDKSGKRQGIVLFLRETPGFLMIWISGLLMMTFHCMTNTYMLQIVQKAGGGSDALGVTLGIAAVMELPVMFAYGKISKRLSAKLLYIITGGTFIIKGTLYLIAADVAVIWISQIFQMLSFAIYANLSVSYAEVNVKKEYRTLSQSLMSATISAGTVIGSLIGGLLIKGIGTNGMLIASCLIAIAGLIVVFPGFSVRKDYGDEKICVSDRT